VSFWFWGGGSWRLFGRGGDIGYTRITWDDWETLTRAVPAQG
jgi:hypothetical protein